MLIIKDHYTIDSQYIVVQSTMVLHAPRLLEMENIARTVNSQKASHIFPSWVSYGASFCESFIENLLQHIESVL